MNCYIATAGFVALTPWPIAKAFWARFANAPALYFRENSPLINRAIAHVREREGAEAAGALADLVAARIER